MNDNKKLAPVYRGLFFSCLFKPMKMRGGMCPLSASSKIAEFFQSIINIIHSTFNWRFGFPFGTYLLKIWRVAVCSEGFSRSTFCQTKSN